MNKLRKNDSGFVLVACLMMLVVLTLAGIMATNTSIIELLVAANDKLNKASFYRADAGIYTMPKVIRRTVDGNPATPASINLDAMDFVNPSTNAAETATTFYNSIFGFDERATNVSYNLGDEIVDVEIFRSGQENLPGGSVEFASGYEGVGHGSSGGVAILYDFSSTGRAPDDTVAEITAQYKLIPGTAGGL